VVTLGTASNLAGMNQMAFQGLLYDRGISLHYDLADYQADIVSDASPISNLLRIRQLPLLQALYGSVVIDEPWLDTPANLPSV
jgi:hypothetical protein